MRDKMENGPPKEKDDEMKTREQTKRAARSAALTAFVFEVLQTLARGRIELSRGSAKV